jgi:hypothetical protein
MSTTTDEELEKMLKAAMLEEQPKHKLPPGPGRPKGSQNRFTRSLREALLAGAENSIYAKNENDPSAPGSVTAFLTQVANRFPDKYAQMLCKLLPQEIHTQETEFKTEVTYNSVAEVKAALEDAGLTLKQIEQLESMLPVTSNVHNEDEND